jgi:hypothetical protein
MTPTLTRPDGVDDDAWYDFVEYRSAANHGRLTPAQDRSLQSILGAHPVLRELW